MLTKLIPGLRNNRFILFINKAFSSPFYIAFIAILAALSEIFSLEFVTYYIFIVIGIIIPSLFCFDMTGFIPPLLMIHITVSMETFSDENTVIMGKYLYHFIIMMSLAISFLLMRFIFELITEKKRRKQYPRLLIGYAALFVSYLIGGIFSEYASLESTLFGFREIASICATYFLFLYIINFKRMKKEYFAWLLLFYGLAISAEALVFVFKGESVTPGWGVYNDVAGTLAFTIAGAGYLASKKKPYISWLFVLLMFYLLTVTALTTSRGGTLAGLVVTIVCLVLIFVYNRKANRISTAIIVTAYLITFALLYVLDTNFMYKYFGRALGQTIEMNNLPRIETWKYGLEQWLQDPIFGVGWLQCNRRPHIFPARYHNTFVQLLAATGIVGVLAYLWHRYETLKLVFKKPSIEKSFAFISILGLLIASLFDCHFFNIWPGLFYGFLLSFIEGRTRVQEALEKRFRLVTINLNDKNMINEIGKLIYYSDNNIYPALFDNNIDNAIKCVPALLKRNTIFNYKNIKVALYEDKVAGFIVTLDEYPLKHYDNFKKAIKESL